MPSSIPPRLTDVRPTQTDITRDELNRLSVAYRILTRLGQQTAALPDTRLPLWDHHVNDAQHNLAMVLVRFAVGDLVTVDGDWVWPDETPRTPARVIDRLKGGQE